MKLVLNKITDAKNINPNRVEGTLQGLPIIVERVMEGWEVRLRITLDGVPIHMSDVSASDRNQFNNLQEAAFMREDDARERRRQELKKVYMNSLYTE